MERIRGVTHLRQPHDVAVVLLVGHSADAVARCTDLLRKNGYAVVATLDDARAVDLARRRRPEVIVVQGWTRSSAAQVVARAMKLDRRTSIIPTVALGPRSAQERALDAGCERFVRTGSRRLLAAVDQIVGHAARS